MHAYQLIFVYAAIWVIILGRLAYDEWRANRRIEPNTNLTELEGRPKADSELPQPVRMEATMTVEKTGSGLSRGLQGQEIRRAYFYPHQVVSDPHLTREDKRAILSTWASDMHAVESMPALRHMPGTPFPVTYSAIMDARAQLDRICGLDIEPDEFPPGPRPVRARRPRPIAQTEAA